MEKPQLSIVIITLNEQYWIERVLKSLCKQTFQDFEIIVADYNSTDKTREIAKSYGCKITDGGIWSVGRNKGYKLALADYLFFLDADCELPNDFLEINFKVFKESGKGTGTTEVKPISDKYFDKFFFKMYDYWSRIMSKISPHCCGASIFSTRECFDKVGGFDDNVCFGENHDFVRRGGKENFIILPRYMYTSVRRLDKDGRFKFVCKYIYSGLYRLFYKEINEELFEYDNQRNPP